MCREGKVDANIMRPGEAAGERGAGDSKFATVPRDDPKNKSPLPPLITYTVILKIAEVQAYWDRENRPTHTRAGRVKTRRGGVLGYRVEVSTTRYRLFAQGMPRLREQLKEDLETEGFSDIRVIPDDTYPYKWLKDAGVIE